MKVFIDDDRCAGHGVCCTLCPAVFELTPDGYAEVTVDEVPPEHEAAVADAVRSCPEHAITTT